ncbi:uncharacterized protein J3D65DRAFT_268781 [Phyllosticta citribraziliensis]|uniref:Secreted protein n=1 Tax=Phyllosticta citribraziliensis TaxID=989973 RepID=A0ABR1M116_9PEZI
MLLLSLCLSPRGNSGICRWLSALRLLIQFLKRKKLLWQAGSLSCLSCPVVSIVKDHDVTCSYTFTSSFLCYLLSRSVYLLCKLVLLFLFEFFCHNIPPFVLSSAVAVVFGRPGSHHVSSRLFFCPFLGQTGEINHTPKSRSIEARRRTGRAELGRAGVGMVRFDFASSFSLLSILRCTR